MTCNRCRFAAKDEVSGTLWCRRAPPHVILKANGDITSLQSPVYPQGWCGEFRLALKRLFRGHVKA